MQEAFNTRELLKVKTLGASPSDVRALSNDLNDLLACLDTDESPIQAVQVIGSIVILCRPFPEESKIELP